MVGRGLVCLMHPMLHRLLCKFVQQQSVLCFLWWNKAIDTSHPNLHHLQFGLIYLEAVYFANDNRLDPLDTTRKDY